MQEEITQKTLALCVEASKMTAQLLQQAMKKVLADMEKHKNDPQLRHGKQTLRQLMKHNTGVSNIEITDQNIKAFSAIPVDLILFADTGGEHPHTYAYLDIMDRWLEEHGMPKITRVYKTTKDGRRLTLEDECLKGGTLPSIAYGFKRCSLKHKIGPQEKFCNNYPPCRKVWVSGKKVVKFIGYDAGEHYRSNKVLLRDLADPKYSKWYPLMEWGWDREACIRAIKAEGLPQPGKSSCFFCPSMRAEEIIDLREHYPDLFRRALALEDNARANLKTVRGLGRNYSWKERFGKEQCNHGND